MDNLELNKGWLEIGSNLYRFCCYHHKKKTYYYNAGCKEKTNWRADPFFLDRQEEQINPKSRGLSKFSHTLLIKIRIYQRRDFFRQRRGGISKSTAVFFFSNILVLYRSYVFLFFLVVRTLATLVSSNRRGSSVNNFTNVHRKELYVSSCIQ